MKYFKDTQGALYVDPIYANHEGLVEIDVDEFDELRQPTIEQVIAINESMAKFTRTEAIDADINVFGVNWQVAKNDRENIKEVIDYAEANDMPAETTQNWILSDNSLRASTKSDLQAVLNAYIERKQQIFYEYVVWRSGNKNEPFLYSGN